MKLEGNGPSLLVSVRSLTEAEEALAGGADVIDIKEPDRGSLGRAEEQVIQEIVARIDGSVPVSAALGELTEGAVHPPKGLTFVKWGLAGMGAVDWRVRFEAASRKVDARVVVVAYVDQESAGSPSIRDVVDYALERRKNLLLDTFDKRGSRCLLDFVTENQLRDVVGRGREAGITVALAGSLSRAAIERLGSISPDLFAVRSAACVGGRRGRVRADLVRDLAAVLRSRVCEN